MAAPDDLDKLVDTLAARTPLHDYIAQHQGEQFFMSERLVVSPGVGWGSRNRAHSPNEFMRLVDFENAARHIARLLARFAAA